MEKYLSSSFPRQQSTSDRILLLLKMRGAQTAAVLAAELGITKEATRLQLNKLAEEGLVAADTLANGVGRPGMFYSLSGLGLKRFPDGHADLTVQLINSIKTIFGDEGLDQLIASREKLTLDRYKREMAGLKMLEEKLECLARVRSAEGYMARWEKNGQAFLFIENHCPICAAATECQGFCRAELQNFREALGSDVSIDRVDHILADGERCAYKIIAKDSI